MKNILEKAKEMADDIITARRYLHAHPGVGFELDDTVAFVARELEKLGITYKKLGRAGITATLGDSSRGRCVLLRADMDALEIKEESDEAFAAHNGRMHACGHDMHTAMLLGAARLLKEYESELNGCVKLMFEPAEEILSGSWDMIDAGVLDSPAVDAAVMIHVMTGIPIDTGSVITAPPGVSAPAADMFEIEVSGMGTHGSMPEKGVDPLLCAAHTVCALCEINARELAVSERAALTVGSFSAGKAANAIPDTAILKGSLRAYNDKTREKIKKRVGEIALNIAAAFHAKAETRFTSGCPTLINDARLSKSVHGYMRELLGEDRAKTAEDMASGSSGSEDFAYVSHKVPTIMLALAAGDSRCGYEYPLHHPKVRFDESALHIGAAVYAVAAMRLLKEQG